MSAHSDDRPATVLPDTPGQTDAERIAQSIVPYARDDARARYLGLRCSGFSIREALRLIGYSHSALTKWRADEEFLSLENRLPEFRKELSLEYTNLEFVRNFRLVMEKDYRILQKSLDIEKDGTSVEMTEDELEYLKKLRTHYTPQQLQIVEAIIKADSPGTFDFTEFAITAYRTKEEVSIVGKKKPTLVIEAEGGEQDG